MGSHLAAEVQEMFEEIESSSREELWIRTCIDREIDRGRLAELRAEVRADPVKMSHRRQGQLRYVKAREQVDRGYRESRRARSRDYARELREAKDAVRVDKFWEQGGVIPGIVVGVDVPMPADARLKGRVADQRRRHAETERARRKAARAGATCPLLEALGCVSTS